MSDIFKDKNIYPYEGSIKDHFKDFYDTVFVVLLPFFQIDQKPANETKERKSNQINYEENKKELEIIKEDSSFTGTFSYSNNDYPTEEEIYKYGKTITWDTICKGCGFTTYSELNKALRTSVGALRQIFQKPELAKKVNAYTDSQNIWHPENGSFDTLSKVAIYKALNLLKKNKIIVCDEFYEATSSLEFGTLTDFEFSEKISYKDYYLYAADKEILFTIDWDSFFFLIATDGKKMKQIMEAKLFEGFLCNEKTQHEWDYKQGELQALLDIEEKQKLK